MKTSITHLPESKQKEIKQILQIIIEEAKPEKVILFGSHANQDWVDDQYSEDGIRFTYNSDYDFLIVLDEQHDKEQSIITKIENRTDDFRNTVSVIIHPLSYINEGLIFGQYFFTDILNKGIELYDTGRHSFLTAKPLTATEEKQKAQDYYDLWYPKGRSFLKGAGFYLQENDLSTGTFLLHQSTECFYSAILLVFYGYKPKTHNLHKLRNYSKHISNDLYTLFQSQSNNENKYYLFDLLRRSYIDARYKLNYSISIDEMKQLIDCVSRMGEIVKELCEKKISEFNSH